MTLHSMGCTNMYIPHSQDVQVVVYFWGLATTCYTVGGDFEYMCVHVHLTLHLLYSFNLQVGQKKPFGKEFSAISGSVLLNKVLEGGGGRIIMHLPLWSLAV